MLEFAHPEYRRIGIRQATIGRTIKNSSVLEY